MNAKKRYNPVPIDRDIPIPVPRGGSVCKWPFDKLEIGDSFIVPNSVIECLSFTTEANKRYGPRRFISRQVSGGRRFWRIQ